MNDRTMNDRPAYGAIVGGAVFILIGVTTLLRGLDVWTLQARYLLPLLLIVTGAGILLGRRDARPGLDAPRSPRPPRS
jgi:hypothetical protein